MTRVVHGANEGEYQLGGYSVGQVARSLREVFNIPADAIATVNGRQVPTSHLLTDDDFLEFVKVTGCKGGLHDYWSEEEVKELFGDEAIEKLRSHGVGPVLTQVFTSVQLVNFQVSSREPSANTAQRRLIVDFSTMTLKYGDQQVEIDGSMQFKLLGRLAIRPGHYVHIDDLKRDVWKEPAEVVDDETVNRTARRLRKTLSDLGLKGVELRTANKRWALILTDPVSATISRVP